MDLVEVIRRVQRKKADRERANTQIFCFACKDRTTLVTAEEAAEFHQFTLDEISQYAADGAFHWIYSSDGEILFCENSVLETASHSQMTLPAHPEFTRALKAAA